MKCPAAGSVCVLAYRPRSPDGAHFCIHQENEMKYTIATEWRRLVAAVRRLLNLPPATDTDSTQMRAHVEAWETEGGRVQAPASPLATIT